MHAADLDEYLERTVRFDGVSIPSAALREEDGPTTIVPPPAMAVLAARSARSTNRRAAYSGYPPMFTGRRLRGPFAQAAEAEDPEMRAAVIGIWMVAAFLFATLGILVK
jgi:hypothetical protein